MDSVVTQFRTILEGLRATIGAHLARNRAREAALVLVWSYLGRTIRRFETLFTRWQSGTLPKSRRSRAGQIRTPRDRKPEFPRSHCWVVAEIGYQAAGRGGQLEHLLQHPGMVEFLHAVPRAGRLLRPLCDMLGLTSAHAVPAVLALRAPPRPRAAPPEPPPPRGIIEPPEDTTLRHALPPSRIGLVFSR